MARPHRPTVNLSAEEAAALQAHPEYTGSLGGIVRLLALRQVGMEQADPYAAHRAYARDERGLFVSNFNRPSRDANKAIENVAEVM